MTKAGIVELVLLRLEGGDYADSQYTEQEIAQYIEMAYNKLYKVNMEQSLQTGERIPPSAMLARFQVNASQALAGDQFADFNEEFYKMDLPLSPINIADGMGVWRVHHAEKQYGGALREFIPVPKGQLFMAANSLINADFLNSIDYYEWTEGKVLHLRAKDSDPFATTQDTPFVVYMLVNNFGSLSDTDVAGFPADMVSDIVAATVQLLTGMPEDDSSNNFNNKPNR